MKNFDNYSYEELLKKKVIGRFEIGALCVVTSALTALLKNPVPFISFLGLTYQLSDNEYKIEKAMAQNDEDIKAIRIIYNEVLENTIKEFKNFDIQNPIEVYQLFDAMFRYGSFSYDLNIYHPLKMSKLKITTMGELLFFNGHGVCRHLAAFLNKIYESLGYESNIAAGHLNTIELEELYEFIYDCKKTSTLTGEEINKKLITEHLKPGIFSKLNYDKNGGYGNHAVIRVNFESMTILADAATENIFYSLMDDIYSTLPTSEEIFLLNRESTKLFNEESKLKEFKEYKEYQLEKIALAAIDGIHKAKKLTYTFDSFHKDNLPALEEAENLTQKVLKKKY